MQGNLIHVSKFKQNEEYPGDGAEEAIMEDWFNNKGYISKINK